MLRTDMMENIVYINDVKLKNNAQLIRFNNNAGVPYSAIYSDGLEMFSCERYKEKDMIKAWNETY